MKFLSETKASIIFLAIMSLILGLTTLVESFAGSDVASVIYHNPGTIVLWALLVINWLLIWQKLLKSKKIPLGSTLLHLSFVVMLTGAFVSMASSTEGRMHLEAGDTKGMILKDNGHPAGLPFTIGLDSLQISRYPGTDNPSGFTSYVTITADGQEQKRTVSVNHPLRIKGWRIYQSSYDPETNGSVFSIAHDPFGTSISYFGYALLLIAFIMLMFSPASRFSQLRKRLATLGCLALLLLTGAPEAKAADKEKVDMDRIMVQDSRGRIVPLDSYCRELMRKVHHSESWNGKNAVETIFSIMAEPNSVYNKPFIYQDNKEIASLIGQTEGKYARYSSMFDSNGYFKIVELVDEAMAVPARQRSKMQKDLLKLDEKVNIIYSLFEQLNMPMFPEPGSGGTVWRSSGGDLSAFSLKEYSTIRNNTTILLVAPTDKAIEEICEMQSKYAGDILPSPGRVRQELLISRVKPFKASAMAYMFCALLLMACTMLIRKGGRSQKRATTAALAATAIIFILHSWGIAARWYCSGQPPLSNSYEVTVFLSWCVALLSLALSRRSAAASAFGVLFAGALLLVAGMNDMDPAITPLVPVLQSPWLMFHVAVIIAGYGCFAINFLLSLYGLGTMAHSGPESTATGRAAILVEIFAIVGLMLMTVGTFLGAVWAGESWGSYWSWDPKETWALITILIYVITTHSRLVPKLNSPKWLFILSIIGMLSVLMTYFGVNYFLVGMHSYAG